MIEKINEPILPDIVLLGLMFESFFPPIFFPTKYPPVSVKIHISKTNQIHMGPALIEEFKIVLESRKIIEGIINIINP